MPNTKSKFKTKLKTPQTTKAKKSAPRSTATAVCHKFKPRSHKAPSRVRTQLHYDPELSLQLSLQYLSNEKNLPTIEQMRWWIAVALALTMSQLPRHPVEITLRIVDAAESAALNHEYRHKNHPTNILSFPLQNVSEEQQQNRNQENYRENYRLLLGDFVVCASLVKSEALGQGKSIDAHWAHLLIHGTLHLLGFTHNTSKNAAQMEAQEVFILNLLGYDNPYR
jgi:probable rRNA maturation factor